MLNYSLQLCTNAFKRTDESLAVCEQPLRVRWRACAVEEVSYFGLSQIFLLHLFIVRLTDASVSCELVFKIHPNRLHSKWTWFWGSWTEPYPGCFWLIFNEKPNHQIVNHRCGSLSLWAESLDLDLVPNLCCLNNLDSNRSFDSGSANDKYTSCPSLLSFRFPLFSLPPLFLPFLLLPRQPR